MKSIRQHRLLQFLEKEELVWRDADHPELSRGADAWVRRLRRESEKRTRKIVPVAKAHQ